MEQLVKNTMALMEQHLTRCTPGDLELLLLPQLDILIPNQEEDMEDQQEEEPGEVTLLVHMEQQGQVGDIQGILLL